MTELEKNIIISAKNGRLMDCISSEGYQMTKDQLVTIAKELAYELYRATTFQHSEEEANRNIAQELIELWAD